MQGLCSCSKSSSVKPLPRLLGTSHMRVPSTKRSIQLPWRPSLVARLWPIRVCQASRDLERLTKRCSPRHSVRTIHPLQLRLVRVLLADGWRDPEPSAPTQQWREALALAPAFLANHLHLSLVAKSTDSARHSCPITEAAAKPHSRKSPIGQQASTNLLARAPLRQQTPRQPPPPLRVSFGGSNQFRDSLNS